MRNRIINIVPQNCTFFVQELSQYNERIYLFEKDISRLGWMNNSGIINSQYTNTDLVINFKSLIDTYNQILQRYQDCVGQDVVLRDVPKRFVTLSDNSIKYIKI